MANYSIMFHDKDDLKTIECWESKEDEIRIVLKEENENCERINTFGISLDISTAIKFAKTLRTEINKAKGLNHER